jgi:hypothetical protein
MSLTRVAVFAFGSLGVFATPAFAAPPNPKAVCIAAHEQAQQLRTDKKPHAAKDKFIACAKSECPVVVRKECTDQIQAMDQIAPTVTLAALDDKGGADIAVKVTLDGQEVAQKLDGSALDVEPGDHTFVFARASDGKTLEQNVLVAEGDKDRKIVADFQTLLPPKPPPPPPPVAAKKEIPLLAYVAGGVGVAGLLSFTAFSIIGRGKENDLSHSCSPHCTPSQVSPVKQDYAIGDISLIVGVIGLVAGVVIALPAFTQSSSPAALGPKPWMPKIRVASTEAPK